MITDLAAQAKEWALDEARKQCFTEDYGVDLRWVPMPAQSRTDGGVQMIAAWWLVVTCRNPLLGEGPLHHTVMVGDPAKADMHIAPQEAVVRAAVGEGIRMLRDLAASKLAGINGGAPKVPLKGSR